MQTQQDVLVEAYGGLRPAIEAAIALSRAFWSICLTEQAHQNSPKKDLYRRDLSLSLLNELYATRLAVPAPEASFDILLRRLVELKLGWIQDGKVTLRHSIANPLDLVRQLLRGARPDHELKYFVMQNIRRHYQCVQSSSIAHEFQVLSAAVNTMIAEAAAAGEAPHGNGWELNGELLAAFEQVMSRDPAIKPEVCDLFVECCRAIKYIRLSWRLGCVEFNTANLDAEYLLSRLFGLPTDIKGLDDLFGGGGIMFVDASETALRDRIGGRAVVTVGQFGSGKSLLSLQMAVEVARKGGVAWVMPLEQTAEECLYTLESMGCLRDDAPLRVATTVPQAQALLENPSSEKGALILLRTVKENFDDFLAAFEENVQRMSQYSLRLIVVDPVSALAQKAPRITDKRARLLELFDTVKRKGTNIWLVAEEGLPIQETHYEQHIADTVIRLSSENRHGYSQRYIEITKSRLQREQRGRHPFAIGPGRGITVYPSSAAVRSRMQMRTERAPEAPIKFGLETLDEILGERALYAGDVIVLQGMGGCFKTDVGISFLLSADWGSGDKAVHRERPLLVSARDDKQTIRHALEQSLHVRNAPKGPRIIRRPDDVRVAAIEGGYVKPGYILQRIEDEFLESRLDGHPIGRVMIDNVGHWELSCPYIREEETFGDTLIAVLRGHGVTTVLTCGDPPSRHGESSLQRSVLDHADCLIQFERIEFRGTSRVMVRVLKTRDMTHRREWFELVAGPRKLEIKTASSLLRVSGGGKVNPVKVRLFLHAESDAQSAYNKTILMTVRSILSRETHLEAQTLIHFSRALNLGSASAIDELQILQLDEFQLPLTDRSSEGDLQTFPAVAWTDNHWKDVIPRLRERVQAGNHYAAVPFYVNIGLLTYRADLPKGCLTSWRQLSVECARWERENTAPGDVFFDFPMVSSENYNVMFLEILLSLAGPPSAPDGPQAASCVFRNWLTSSAAVEANLIMYRLCRRAFNVRHEPGSQDVYQPTPFQVNARARVWRHWYSTLNQMFSEMLPSERAEISVAPLPGEISVAGEWFLGVPRYSAAPDVGLKIIQLYTSREAELDRLKYGVGLPVRGSFYTGQEDASTNVSPFFSMHGPSLLAIVEGAFRRSSFACYRAYGSMLSTHLQSVLMLPVLDEQHLEREIRAKVSSLNYRLAFAESPTCAQCRRFDPAPALRQENEVDVVPLTVQL